MGSLKEHKKKAGSKMPDLSIRSRKSGQTTRRTGRESGQTTRRISREQVRANNLRTEQRKRRSAQSSQAKTGKVQRSIRPSTKDKIIRKLPYLGIAAAVLLLVWGAVTFKHWHAIRKYDKTRIAANVRIGDVNVSGLTKKEAQKKLKRKLKNSRKQTVTLSVDSRTGDTTLKDLGLTIKNYETLPDEALAYGSSGSINKRFKNIKALEKGPYVIPLEYKLDGKKASAALEDVCKPLEEGPVNAQLEISGSDIKVTEGRDGMVVDKKATIGRIEKTLNDKWDGDTVYVKVKSSKAHPEVKAEDLKVVRDKLGSYETSFAGSDAGRAKNIEVGVSYVNGSIVQPGETFSTDAAMRPYTEERGYEEAASYESGDIVNTLGGGICQISSTLYNAVLYSELEVVERKPHSMRVSYVEPGRDAAIAGDVKDFKFKNDTDYPVYIYGQVKDEKVMFAIYGKETRDKSRKIEFESEILDTTDFTTVYKGSTDPIGNMYISANGHEGMTAKLWKTVTENGKKGEPEEVNTSSYSPQNTVISVGISSKNAGATNIVSSAIATQNEATIKQAISQAAGM